MSQEGGSRGGAAEGGLRPQRKPGAPPQGAAQAGSRPAEAPSIRGCRRESRMDKVTKQRGDWGEARNREEDGDPITRLRSLQGPDE